MKYLGKDSSSSIPWNGTEKMSTSCFPWSTNEKTSNPSLREELKERWIIHAFREVFDAFRELWSTWATSPGNPQQQFSNSHAFTVKKLLLYIRIIRRKTRKRKMVRWSKNSNPTRQNVLVFRILKEIVRIMSEFKRMDGRIRKAISRSDLVIKN